MMFKNLNGLFKIKSDFTRNVLTLITGVVIAQAIPFLLSPVLSRIYTMEDFGEYAIYNSFIGVLMVLSTARFEYAIALPKEDINGFRIVKLILIITFSVATISLMIFVFFNKNICHIFRITQNSHTLFLIPITLIFVGIFQSLTFWYNRKKNYKLQAISKLTSSVGQSSSSLLLGSLKFNSLGLIISYIAGQIIGVVPLILKIGKREYLSLKKLERRELGSLAKRYKKFPTYMTIGSLLNSVSVQLPILMITSLYSTKIVGAMSFAQTIIVVPTGLISTAFADVLRQRAVEDFNSTGSCRPLLLKTLKKLFIIGIVPFVILFFIAPSLFSFLFGNEWKLAGEFAQIMTFMFFIRFVFMSVSGTIIIVSEKLEYDILWQVGYLVSTFLSIYLGNYFFKDIRKVLILMALVSSLFYFISFLMAYRFSEKKFIYET
jgi:O-antigen/teichoic acid export membrane protein